MKKNIRNDIIETKKYLRKQVLDTILNQFDGKLMGLSKEHRKQKYNKMRENPYSFFRGSAYLFYYDVTDLPFTFHTPEDRPTWLLGDLHFDNISAFQNEHQEIVFDVDDFDEGYFGSYLYDVMRMVVSIRLMSSQHGYNEEDADTFVESFLTHYIKQLEDFQSGANDPVQLQFTKVNTKASIKRVLDNLEQRQTAHKLDESVNKYDSIQWLMGDDHLLSLSTSERKEFTSIWEDYIDSIPASVKKRRNYYSVKDVMKKEGAGIGSTGLERYYILIEGEHGQNIILEAKEARAPIPAYFFPYDEKFWYDHKHQGRRVVHTQQSMHHLADPYLGYFTLQGHDFYVRERSPLTGELEAQDLQDPKSMLETIKTMARITAKIHARADADIENGLMDYHSEEAILDAIQRNQKEFIQQINVWSKHYQQVVEEDFLLFNEWLDENADFSGQK
ncbi:DUF2252 domain-containing protein [Halobacillus shinanisalinarum]|uniref:DUF2252 domain-containing protein n=1 Tax=Halobacillus shinanisalinarum TaxID=2932258 RepID=A0ABY4GZH5_9BACI|nr:DUF2252 family protein [Halobacillus shinanisalinarum]UOQ93499.1 DUF2252 domain-containing protein [Halobacillus shinanisalinarum]